MTDEQNTGIDQNEFMKRMKAIASDLWGSVVPGAEEEPDEPEEPEKTVPREPEKPKTDILSVWKTADAASATRWKAS